MSVFRSAVLTHARLLAVGGGLAVLVGTSCAERRDVYLEAEGTSSGFVPAEAGATSDGDASSERVAMCPLTTCTLPWATCPSSEFPCGTNLLTDNDNCGRCGNSCGQASDATHSQWTCVEGQCVFSCLEFHANCDGDVTNGCETYVNTDANCGSCGKQCGGWEQCLDMQCYDRCVLAGLPDKCDRCTDLMSDDDRCGTCTTRCPAEEPGKPSLPADMYYGCGGGKCGQAKCAEAGKADCNGVVTDGCETALHTNENCRGCNDQCPAGQDCINFGGVWNCLCPAGETLCGGDVCTKTDDNIAHCGGCNRRCPGFRTPHFQVTCSKGICGGKCEDGYADCDELGENGCEVDTRIDNRHCGGCGNACLPDQVCFQGTCQVTPCDAGPGVEAK